MCSINRYQALVGGRKLDPSDMQYCPCLQVAGKFHGEFFSFWIEKNSLTKHFGIKDKHFSSEQSVLWSEGPESESPIAIYLTDSLEEVFVTPVGVKAPENALRIGWVSFPKRIQSMLGTFLEELSEWTKACCLSLAPHLGA